MSGSSPTEMLQEIEEDVSRIRNRAEALGKVAEAFEASGESERAGSVSTEARAFELYGNHKGEAFPGYFQPPVVLEGVATDPPLDFFTPERLDHLARRARGSANPIHAARFADVAWDLGKCDPTLAKLAAERHLECLDLYRDNRWGREFEKSADRVARLAHMLKNDALAAKVKERLLAHARAFDASREYEPCMDLAAALAGSHRLNLAREEAEEVLEILDRAAAYYQEEHPARDEAFGVVEGPRELYVRIAHKTKIRLGGKSDLTDNWTERLEIARSLERQGDARPSANRLGALSLYEKAHRAYRNLNATDDLERVRVRLREAGVEARQDMPSVEFRISIPSSVVEEATKHLLLATLTDTLRAIAGSQRLVPSLEQARAEAEERKNTSIGETLMGSRLHLSGGYLVRRSADPNEIEEALLADELTFQINTFFAVARRYLFDKLVSDMNLDAVALADYFGSKNLFQEDTLGLLEHGFERYLAGDHVSALHVLVPRFEAMVRDLLNATGRPTADPSSGGAMTLGTLLSDPVLREAAGEELARYYELTLISPGLGLNLRNGLAHGNLPLASMHEGSTELVLHVLLTLTRFEPYPLDTVEG
jgi:hypothetical protein